MKKYCILCLFILQLYNVTGQSILDTNKLWSLCYFHYWNFSQTTEWVRFTCDTIIGSYTCKRVEVATNQSHTDWSFHGYARETNDKKIYYRVNASQPEKLLYDMNVQVGDSLLVYTLYNYPSAIFDSMMFYVTGKDSVLIGNSYRSEFTLSVKTLGGNMMVVEYWVDSLGSLNAGMLHNANGKVGGDGFFLMCFFENSVLKYHQPDFQGCYILTGNESINKSTENMKFQPNPLTDISRIIVKAIFSNLPLRIEFYDSSGKLFSCYDFINELNLSRKNFKQGLYYYFIFQKNQRISDGKLMVY